MTPKFKHDSTCCTFLGTVTVNAVTNIGSRNTADIYFCDVRKTNALFDINLIYRHSDEPSDYGCTSVNHASGISFWGTIAFSLYINHLGLDGASNISKSSFSKNGKLVLDLNTGTIFRENL